MQAWKVHKFGGSSVADAACMVRVAKIIENDPAPRKAVVLSACRGVTDALLTLIGLAEQDSPALDGRLQELRQRHIGIARELLAGAPEGPKHVLASGGDHPSHKPRQHDGVRC